MEYDDAVRHYVHHRNREWELFRWLGWIVTVNNAHMKKQDKPKTPEDLLSLSIDPEKEIDVEGNKKWGKELKEKLKKKTDGK